MIHAFEDNAAVARQISVALTHLVKAMKSGFTEREDGVLSSELIE